MGVDRPKCFFPGLWSWSPQNQPVALGFDGPSQVLGPSGGCTTDYSGPGSKPMPFLGWNSEVSKEVAHQGLGWGSFVFGKILRLFHNAPNWNTPRKKPLPTGHNKGIPFHSWVGGLPPGVCDIGVCCNFLGERYSRGKSCQGATICLVRLGLPSCTVILVGLYHLSKGLIIFFFRGWLPGYLEIHGKYMKTYGNYMGNLWKYVGHIWEICVKYTWEKSDRLALTWRPFLFAMVKVGVICSCKSELESNESQYRLNIM